MSDTVLAIKNLSKIYPNGVQALSEVSFEVKNGEFLVIIGQSGSGKSTLLRCINRLLVPTSGQILFKGIDVTKLMGDDITNLRTKIAMIFQQFNLIPRNSVLSNVLMGRLAYTGFWKSVFGLFSKEDKSQAFKFLKLVGLGDKAHDRADQLSGGQQQRVAIARALTQEPVLLLADEPVASLDPTMSHVVLDYIKKINQELGITVICNLHFLSLVRDYATRVVALKNGQVVFVGSPAEITEEWFHKIYGEEAKDVRIQ